MPKNIRRDKWLCGYACALANVLRNTNEPQIARMTLHSDGLCIDDLVKAGVEPYDLDEIERAVTAPGSTPTAETVPTWACSRCGYHNAGAICTHCGAAPGSGDGGGDR